MTVPRLCTIHDIYIRESSRSYAMMQWRISSIKLVWNEQTRKIWYVHRIMLYVSLKIVDNFATDIPSYLLGWPPRCLASSSSSIRRTALFCRFAGLANWLKSILEKEKSIFSFSSLIKFQRSKTYSGHKRANQTERRLCLRGINAEDRTGRDYQRWHE